VQSAIAKARYLGLLDWERIVDNRNPPPKGTTQQDERAAALLVSSVDLATAADVQAPQLTYELPGLPPFPLPSVMLPLARTRGRASYPEMPEADDLPEYVIETYRGAQRYAVEVWCEKSTMDDVLLPWCQRSNAQLVTSEGEMTITQAHRAAQRIIRRGKPTVILYVSDFDFKGQQMPVSMARKIQWFLRDADREGRAVPEVVLFPATLTHEQVQRFHLPDEPISDTQKFISKGKRKGADRAQWRKWKTKYGDAQGFVELDAVEGSQEGRLGQLLDEAVAAFYDRRLNVRVAVARQALREHLHDRREEVLAEHAPRLAVARDTWEATQTEADDLLDNA
jgi:hypothetical protein